MSGMLLLDSGNRVPGGVPGGGARDEAKPRDLRGSVQPLRDE